MSDSVTRGPRWRKKKEDRELYCVCRKPHDDRFMVACDSCEEWFHGDCVGVTEEDNVGDEWRCPACIKVSGKLRGKGGKRRGSMKEDVEEDDGGFELMDSADGSKRRGKRKGKVEDMEVDEVEEEEEKPSKKGIKLILKPPSNELKARIHLPKGEASSAKAKQDEEGGTKGELTDTLEQWWLGSKTPLSSLWPYIPQEGDEAMYIPSAHRVYLKTHKDPRIGSRRAPFHRYNSLPAMVYTTISKIRYEHVAEVPHMVVTLEFIPPIGAQRSSSRHQPAPLGPVTCDVLFQPGVGPGSDFLVHKVRYDRAQKEGWAVGDLVTVRVENERGGKGKKDSRTVVNVEYDEEEEDGGGKEVILPAPWLELASGGDMRGDENLRVGSWVVDKEERRRKGARLVLTGGGGSSSIAADHSAWQAKMVIPTLADDQLSKAIAILSKAMADSEASPFVAPVTDDIAPGYTQEVACPMCLELVHDRLEHGYYRQKEAIMADVRLIYENCAAFNGPDEDLTLICKDLMEKIERKIEKALS